MSAAQGSVSKMYALTHANIELAWKFAVSVASGAQTSSVYDAFTKLRGWLANAPEHLFSESAAWQAGAILLAGLFGFLISRIPVAQLRAAAKARLELKPGGDMLGRLYHSLARILWPAFTVALLWIATIIFGAVGDLENAAFGSWRAC